MNNQKLREVYERNIAICKEEIRKAEMTIEECKLGINAAKRNLKELAEPIVVKLDFTSEIQFIIPPNDIRGGNPSFAIGKENYNRILTMPGYETYTAKKNDWVKFFRKCLEQLEEN